MQKGRLLQKRYNKDSEEYSFGITGCQSSIKMSDCKFQEQGCRWRSKCETHLLILKTSEMQPKSNQNRLDFQRMYSKWDQ